eukprot:NODE_1232_length_1691_cov_0.243090.p2 type:complete len:106 gc:universal NODE_1232_length_1691_cov_0.243090:942-625(-)
MYISNFSSNMLEIRVERPFNCESVNRICIVYNENITGYNRSLLSFFIRNVILMKKGKLVLIISQLNCSLCFFIAINDSLPLLLVIEFYLCGNLIAKFQNNWILFL